MKRSALSLLAIAILITTMVLAVEPTLATSPVDNPKEDYWVSKTPMNQTRAGVGVVAVDGKIYAIGGASTAPFIYQTENLVNTTEEYNPTTDSWTIKPSMPTPRAYFGIAAIENKIYCIGGIVDVAKEEIGSFMHTFSVDSTVNEVYDTISETWETKSSMPTSESRFEANVVNGKIYAIGAYFTYIYDPVTDSWTEKTPFPARVSDSWWNSPVSTAVGDQIFVTGEFRTGQRLFVYNTLNDSWSEIVTDVFEAGIGIGAMVGIRASECVYVLGLINWNYDQVNQAYDPLTGNWTSAAPNPIDQRDFGCVVLNDVMYVIGGYVDSGEVTAANQAYYPFGFSALPEIRVLSPLMQVYNESSVSLNFTVDRPVSWMSYSLDKSDNTTIAGNYTLSELSAGVHNVTVYAGDSFGCVGTSETIVFSIAETFPMLTLAIVASSVVIIFVVAISILLYRRHRKTVESGVGK